MGTQTNTGVVKFFNNTKGFGFIIDDEIPHREYFFHISKVIDKVKEADNVSYTLEEGKRGVVAVNVKLNEE